MTNVNIIKNKFKIFLYVSLAKSKVFFNNIKNTISIDHEYQFQDVKDTIANLKYL